MICKGLTFRIVRTLELACLSSNSLRTDLLSIVIQQSTTNPFWFNLVFTMHGMSRTQKMERDEDARNR